MFITAKNTGLKLPTMVVSTTIQIGYINLHVVEVTLLGNFNFSIINFVVVHMYFIILELYCLQSCTYVLLISFNR